ncbi:hypothetical protein PHJA_001566700 [Phtheirospermum japonicum]|uniref:KIB1-4 beta-propeller domain-containing protein n=1 Tax=Phtheirospermum japonicum TaxID=374723 RepID=A0A830C7R7_9LAMI|nr:hypothetical protein PHJA_001566700 [Phtheirospermum japonicum]
MVYQFYSLAEDKVVSLDKKGSNECGPDNDAKIVGSSHGWLALFHEHNCDLFLYNPISGRHIKLPPLSMGNGRLSKIIISSSSPHEEDCRAVITYGPEDRLAFCCPGRTRSTIEWTLLGDCSSYQYESLAYSSKQKLFFCARTHDDLEAWNLRDPLSPRMTPIVVSVEEDSYPLAARSELELDLKLLCEDYKFLVVAEMSDELFHVRRFVMTPMGPDGSDESVPYMTVGFDVHKYDPETGSLVYMDRSLGGLVIFIGCNDGFALSTAEFPELKPNSIYFTDVRSPLEWIVSGYGGHDLGIFNYQDQTFTSCYYPCDFNNIKRIVPTPMWFTPL